MPMARQHSEAIYHVSWRALNIVFPTTCRAAHEFSVDLASCEVQLQNPKVHGAISGPRWFRAHAE